MTDLHPCCCCCCCSCSMRVSPPPWCWRRHWRAMQRWTGRRRQQHRRRRRRQQGQVARKKVLGVRWTAPDEASKQASLLVSPSSSSQQARKNHYVFTVLRCSCNDDWGLELLLLLTAVARRRQALLLPFLACIGASDDGSCRQSSQIRIMFFAIGKWWPWPSPSSLYCCSTEDHCVPQ